ncbi:MAG: recombination regulator RecX [Thiobacillaceae bacterium]
MLAYRSRPKRRTKLHNKPEISLRNRALTLLARREHSRFELARKLERIECDPEELSSLLDEFESKNWLSDRRFAQSYVADHRAREGAIKLAYALRQRGVSDALIADALESLNERGDGELKRARDVWRKKFGVALDSPQGRIEHTASERARQMRFLLGRGFSSEIIRQVLRQTEDESGNE